MCRYIYDLSQKQISGTCLPELHQLLNSEESSCCHFIFLKERCVLFFFSKFQYITEVNDANALLPHKFALQSWCYLCLHEIKSTVFVSVQHSYQGL